MHDISCNIVIYSMKLGDSKRNYWRHSNGTFKRWINGLLRSHSYVGKSKIKLQLSPLMYTIAYDII